MQYIGEMVKTRKLVSIGLLAAVMAVLAPLSIPTAPVPFSLGVFAVALAGALLPPASSVASVLVYILLGTVGIPVFANFTAGPQILAGPTGGYIVGYLFLALGLSLATASSQRLAVQMGLSLASLAVFYAIGTAWFAFVTGNSFVTGLLYCVVPFLLFDLVKITAALSVAKLVKRRLGSVAL